MGLLLLDIISPMSERYDPNVHHRRSVRLSGYDYSEEGWYFITVCTQDRRCMFGVIIEDHMQLNAAGSMVESWWTELTGKFPIIRTDEYIVMPNHFHGIINVGAALCGRPNIDASNRRSGQPHGVAPTAKRQERCKYNRYGAAVLCVAGIFLKFRLTKVKEVGLIALL